MCSSRACFGPHGTRNAACMIVRHYVPSKQHNPFRCWRCCHWRGGSLVALAAAMTSHSSNLCLQSPPCEATPHVFLSDALLEVPGRGAVSMSRQAVHTQHAAPAVLPCLALPCLLLPYPPCLVSPAGCAQLTYHRCTHHSSWSSRVSLRLTWQAHISTRLLPPHATHTTLPVQSHPARPPVTWSHSIPL